MQRKYSRYFKDCVLSGEFGCCAHHSGTCCQADQTTFVGNSQGFRCADGAQADLEFCKVSNSDSLHRSNAVAFACCHKANAQLYDCSLSSCNVGVCAKQGSTLLMVGGTLEVMEWPNVSFSASRGRPSCCECVGPATRVEIRDVHARSSKFGFSCIDRGELCLLQCDADRPDVPYKQVQGGQIFCHMCVPDDKSLPPPPILPA